jgi:(2Fe-2S) ferredoxin
MKQHVSPYTCHLFVCIKSRGGKGTSCGDSSGSELKAVLKGEIKKRGWKSVARVCESSCLGVCDVGPNIMIYPQKIWLSDVSLDDVPEILNLVEDFLVRSA